MADDTVASASVAPHRSPAHALRRSLADCPEPTAFLTVAEAAASLRVSPQTVRRWVQIGVLRAVRVSQRAQYRIPRSEIWRQVDGAKYDPKPFV